MVGVHTEITVNEETEELTLRRPPSVEEVVSLLRSLPREHDVEPLTDVHGFYERERTDEITETLR